MPYSNPITTQEQQDLARYNPLHPRDGSANELYMPPAYFLVPPATQAGPVKWRLFDAAYISTGIIDPNRLGTGATGAGNLYLADDGQWKPVAGGGGGGDMYKATYDTDNSGIVDKAEALTTLGRNSTGATLYEGTIVRIEGSTGNRPNFVKAQGNNDANSAQTFGVVMTDIANNSDGYVLVQGTLHDLDTRTGAGGATHPFTDVTLADGDLLYLHPTIPGYVTNIKPLAPQHLVYVGVVTRTSPTNGTIVYRIQNGYELYELHDVAPTPYINNGVLYRDTTTNLWKSATISTLLGGTPLLTVPTLAQVTTAGNTTTNSITVGGLIVDTNTLVVDSVNNRVGIGTTTPSTLLEVVGNYAGTSDPLIPQLKFQNSNTTSSAHLFAIARVLVGTGYLGGFPEIWIQAYRDASNNGTTSIRTASNHPLNFWTNDIERLRIFANGNVGINTTTDAGYKLDVNGNVKITGTSLTLSSANSVAFSLFKEHSGGGSATVNFKWIYDSLIVNRSNSTDFFYFNGYYSTVSVRTSTGAAVNALGVLGLGTTSSTNSFQTYNSVGTSTFIIRDDGNVGVGTSSPAYKLDVYQANVKVQIRTTAENQNATLFFGTNFDAASLPKTAIIAQGLGSWSRANLHFCLSTSDVNNAVEASLSDSKMVIFNSGNVAIGSTTNAGYKLDVNGTMRSVGLITAPGGISTVGGGIQIGDSTAGAIFYDASNRIYNNTAYGWVLQSWSYNHLTATNGLLISNSTSSTKSSNSYLQVVGSTTAASAIGRGVYFNNTLVAAANNDVLVGLDIDPTFTSGAFTGLSRLAARFVGNVLMGQVPSSLVAYSYVPLTLSNNAVGALKVQLALVNGGGFANAGSAIDFFTYTDAGNGNPGLRIAGLDDGAYSGNFQIITKAQGGAGTGALSTKLQLFGGTGNLVLQSGGAFTDAGYRLDVNGTVRIQGATFDFINTSAVYKLGYSTVRYTTFEAQSDGATKVTVNGTTKFYIGASTLSGIEIPHLYSIAFVNPGTATYSHINWSLANSQFELKNGTQTAFVDLAVGKIKGVLTNATHTSQVYYNTTTGELTYGALPTPATPTLAQVVTAGNSSNADIYVNGVRIGRGGTQLQDTNTVVGRNALGGTVGSGHNTAIGNEAFYSWTIGLDNTGVGSEALYSLTGGSRNVALGRSALRAITGSNNNIGIGDRALTLAAGSNNVGIGSYTGYGGGSGVGSGNVFIGYQAGYNETGSNTLYIANSSTNTIIYGNFATGNVSIGSTTDAGYKLDINGTARVTSTLTANSFVKSGGTSSQFLKADGSVDSNTYLTTVSDIWVNTTGDTMTGQLVISTTGTGGNPTLRVNTSTSSAYVHSQENIAANLTSGQRNILVVGQATDTKNSGYFGYYWAGAGSDSNFITMGHWGNNDLFRIYGNGNANFQGYLSVGANNPATNFEVIGSDAEVIVHFPGNSRGGLRALGGQLVGFMSTAASDDLVFGWENGYKGTFTERMRIDNGTGNVLINTTTDSGYKLDVNGNFRATSNAILSTTAGSGTVIGTTTPLAKLHVQGGDVLFLLQGDSASGFYFPTQYIRGAYPRLVFQSEDGAVTFGGLDTTQNTSANPWGNLAISSRTAMLFFIQSYSGSSPVFSFDGSNTYVANQLNVSTNLVVTGNVTVDTNTFFINASTNRVGIGTTSPSVLLQAGAKVIDDNNYAYTSGAGMFVNQTQTSASVLNDPQEVLILARQGTAGQAFGAAAVFELSRFENSGTASRTRLDIKLADGSFLSGSARVLTMLSNGNVGVGTTSPAYNFDIRNTSLQVHLSSLAENQNVSLFFNTAYDSSTLPRTAIIASAVGSWSRSALYFCLNNATSGNPGVGVADVKMAITPAGNVGIGTTSPDALLTVSADKFGTLGGAISVVNSSEGGGSVSAIYMGSYARKTAIFYNWTSNYGRGELIFATNNVADGSNAWVTDGRMYIKSNGNVTIGTSTDSGFKLDVNGNVAVRGNLDMSSATNRYIYGYNGNYINLYNGGTGGIDIYGVVGENKLYGSLRVTGNLITQGSFSMNGNLDIGNGNTVLAMSNAIRIYRGFDASMQFILGHPTVGDFIWQYPENTTLMTLKRGGNLLVGTTTDAGYKLDVNGSFRSNGDSYVTSANGRVFGFDGLSAGQTLHFQYGGDSSHRISTTHGSATQMDVYHGLIIRTSTASGGKALIVNQRNSAHFIQEWQENGTQKAYINSQGNLYLAQLDAGADGPVISTSGLLSSVAGYTGTVTIQQPAPLPNINIQVDNGIITNVF